MDNLGGAKLHAEVFDRDNITHNFLLYCMKKEYFYIMCIVVKITVGTIRCYAWHCQKYTHKMLEITICSVYHAI